MRLEPQVDPDPGVGGSGVGVHVRARQHQVEARHALVAAAARGERLQQRASLGRLKIKKDIMRGTQGNVFRQRLLELSGILFKSPLLL